MYIRKTSLPRKQKKVNCAKQEDTRIIGKHVSKQEPTVLRNKDGRSWIPTAATMQFLNTDVDAPLSRLFVWQRLYENTFFNPKPKFTSADYAERCGKKSAQINMDRLCVVNKKSTLHPYHRALNNAKLHYQTEQFYSNLENNCDTFPERWKPPVKEKSPVRRFPLLAPITPPTTKTIAKKTRYPAYDSNGRPLPRRPANATHQADPAPISEFENLHPTFCVLSRDGSADQLAYYRHRFPLLLKIIKGDNVTDPSRPNTGLPRQVTGLTTRPKTSDK
ncbi:uncharacterized protein LOC106174062 [Lingula anatina]|uniref:Uncharacterized protein LOC106174062 n=1 Tax=Lingula anatina TaxID=7574 RepID=A0A1S3JKK1_LINAN|nr:uncharacterized protein LOC106174062 [Lingula anatina]|eukprot:XP_013410902.1 uncharacterized protein LOC106174062 [Lingula anatina]